MPSSFTFRPLQANLLHEKDNIGKMDPYCKIKLGRHTAKTSVARGEGKHPHWENTLKLPQKHGETFCVLKMKDQDRMSRDDPIGEVTINLFDAQAKGTTKQWYNMYHKERLAGEVLLEITYNPSE